MADQTLQKALTHIQTAENRFYRLQTFFGAIKAAHNDSELALGLAIMGAESAGLWAETCELEAAALERELMSDDLASQQGVR